MKNRLYEQIRNIIIMYKNIVPIGKNKILITHHYVIRYHFIDIRNKSKTGIYFDF